MDVYSESGLMGTGRRSYGSRTSRLTAVVLAAWVLLVVAVPMLAALLNQLKFLGVPAGFFMAGPGTLIAFVAMGFWFVWRQDRIERQEDPPEDQ